LWAKKRRKAVGIRYRKFRIGRETKGKIRERRRGKADFTRKLKEKGTR